MGILRAPSEEPILYALKFEQKYRGKLLNEAIDLRAVVLEPDETNFIESVGTYELPDLSDDANAET